MKVLIAVDSFKGSLTSFQASNAIRTGILKVFPDAEIYLYPIADGGEGTLDTLSEYIKIDKHNLTITGPLGNKIQGSYGITEDDKTVIIESACACGLTLVPEKLRNPMNTTTYGVGEIIKDAINKDYRNFIIGLGGSATNDGGIGMLQALGYDITDTNGNAVPFGAKGLINLSSISCENVNPNLKECNFCIACDVNNPLCGENGASYSFGAQKGASEATIKELDKLMYKYAKLVKSINPNSNSNYPGAGAAGGLGFAFLAFMKSQLKSGVEIIAEKCGLEKDIKKSDIVITGEGCVDKETARGKLPSGIAKIAKKYEKPVIAIAGSLGKNAEICNTVGIDAYFSAINKPISLSEAIKKEVATKNLITTSEQIFNLVRILKN